MKTIHPLLIFLLLTGILPAKILAQTPYHIKSSKMEIDGTSSLHDWKSEVSQPEWSGLFQVQDNKIVQVKDVMVKILVKSIKSEHGSMMDNKTYDAFKSDKNPVIQYKFSSAKIQGSGPDFTLATTGTLQMAGITQTITMNVTAKLLANGDIQLIGSQKLTMKDYKMDAPTAMMGTIKVGPEVTVKFDLTLTPNK